MKENTKGGALLYDEATEYAICAFLWFSLIVTEDTITVHGTDFASDPGANMGSVVVKCKLRFATHEQMNDDIYTDVNCFVQQMSVTGKDIHAIFRIAKKTIEVPEYIERKEGYEE